MKTQEGQELREFVHNLQRHRHSFKEGEQSPVTAEIVAEAAKSGVSLACAIITRARQGLGVGLVNIVHSFNPEIIIIGDGVTKIGPLFMDPAREIAQ